MTRSSKPVFVVDLHCRNCGNEWRREFGEGIRVAETIGGGVAAFDDEYDKVDEWLDCGVCKIDSKVRIDGREPIGDGDSHE